MFLKTLTRVSLPCFSLALVVAPSASAISIRDDKTYADYEALVNTSPYSSTGQFSGVLTGTLITSEWVFTAAHTAPGSTFTASDGTTRNVVQRVVYPGDVTQDDQNDAADGSDFALIRLSSPINSVPTASLHDPLATGVSYADLLDDIVGLEAVFTGSGLRGNGDDGQTDGRDIIAGTNEIEFTGGDAGSGFQANFAVADFDDPNAAGPPNGVTTLEMGFFVGDSGGGIWVDLDDQPGVSLGQGDVLIGVHSLGGGLYGNQIVSTIITDDVYDWINSTVPEPSSLALLGLGGFMTMRRRR